MQNMPESVYQSRRQRREEHRRYLRRELWAWIGELILVIAVVWVMRSYVFSITTVDGDSMLDTLQTGDRMYVSLLGAHIFGYERFDVVTCYYPGRTDQCVKRIIGMPGETLEIKNGVVYIDGNPLHEDYLEHRASYSYPSTLLADDEYFLLGDNRPISHDSHSADVGPVTHLIGKVQFILWPPERIGAVK